MAILLLKTKRTTATSKMVSTTIIDIICMYYHKLRNELGSHAKSNKILNITNQLASSAAPIIRSQV